MGSSLSNLEITFTLNKSPISHRDNSSHFIRDLNSLLPLLRASLTSDPQGTLLWKWTPDQSLSTNSVYRTCNDPGIPRPQFHQVLQTKAPPRVHFFLWLLLHDKLNTTQNLQKKGWPTTSSCVLCSNNAIELTDHLFSNCPMATCVLRSTWSSISNSRERQRWASTTWTIWKERNARIFRSHARPIDALIHEEREQATPWTTAYRRGTTSAIGVI
jgi:zinc-binding in reverse transcriptase